MNYVGTLMLEKKDVVQKSFRITRQNDIWLGLLSAKLGRTQNELVNIAIKMLLDDNKKWFFEEFIKATFKIEFDQVGILEKRLADTEVKIKPYSVYPNGNVTEIYITYYKSDSSDEVISNKKVDVCFGPGHGSKIIYNLTEVFRETLAKYPYIMKDFNPGANLEEY